MLAKIHWRVRLSITYAADFLGKKFLLWISIEISPFGQELQVCFIKVRRSVYERHGLFATDYQIAADYDLMVRLLWKERLRTKYIKKDFVTMRTGGMSTKNLRNRILINSEDVRACRKYGMYTNRIMICFKYLYKIFEFKL